MKTFAAALSRLSTTQLAFVVPSPAVLTGEFYAHSLQLDALDGFREWFKRRTLMIATGSADDAPEASTDAAADADESFTCASRTSN